MTPVPALPPRPAPFPHHYDVSLDWTPGAPGQLHAPAVGEGALAGPAVLEGGAPPQFGGRADWWSPEHLLLSAVALCFQTTFHALAARANLPVGRLEAKAEGVLDKTKDGLVFTRIRLQVLLAVPPADSERAREVAETAERHCIVSNALRVPVELEVAVLPAA